MPAGHGRGIAVRENASAAIVAQVAEVEVAEAGLLARRTGSLRRSTAAQAINPDTVEAQMQGGIVNGIERGPGTARSPSQEACSVQSNFHDYPVLRMAGAPSIEVHIIESGAAMGGVGEAMVPTLAPAVCNAIHAACGKRIRSLPIKHHGLRTA